jgi:hypothetical protein
MAAGKRGPQTKKRKMVGEWFDPLLAGGAMTGSRRRGGMRAMIAATAREPTRKRGAGLLFFIG